MADEGCMYRFGGAGGGFRVVFFPVGCFSLLGMQHVHLFLYRANNVEPK